MSHNRFLLISILWLALALTACATSQATDLTEAAPVSVATSEGAAETAVTDSTNRPEGWTDATHSNKVAPNYDIVFPQDKVSQLTITIDPDDWQAMQANMVTLLGESGSGRGQGVGGPGGGRPPGNFQPPQGNALPEGGFEPPRGGERPQQPFAGGSFTTENPMWVAATIEFEGNTWTNVGVRYKGNSSLRSGWDSGSLKLPLKLDFDEFEDEYPEIKNQRFYGFKQLSLANGFGDATFMRDALTYDLLEAAGLVAAETAYYEVVIDYGEGPVSLGLYTMIEVIDDTVVERFFGDDSGNIYEGDGVAASLAAGTLAQIADSFQKENNKDSDWNDLEALYQALHSAQRTADPAAWRASLEASFDVDTFLEWLALSAIIEHWDTYGGMTHNYYLYNNPDTGQLTWISWDHNLVLGGMGGPDGPTEAPAGSMQGGFGGRTTVSLDKAEVGDNWPLIRYLLDDPIYYERYIQYMAMVLNDVFRPDALATDIQAAAALIGPYAARESSEAAYATAVQALIDRIDGRYQVVATFLAGQ